MPLARALLKFVGNVAPRGTPWGLGVSLAIPRRCVVIAWWLACRGALVHDRSVGAWWRRVVPASASNDGGAIVVVVVADLGPAKPALPGIAARASIRSAFVCLIVSPLPRRASPRRVRSCGQLWRTTCPSEEKTSRHSWQQKQPTSPPKVAFLAPQTTGAMSDTETEAEAVASRIVEEVAARAASSGVTSPDGSWVDVRSAGSKSSGGSPQANDDESHDPGKQQRARGSDGDGDAGGRDRDGARVASILPALRSYAASHLRALADRLQRADASDDDEGDVYAELAEASRALADRLARRTTRVLAEAYVACSTGAATLARAARGGRIGGGSGGGGEDSSASPEQRALLGWSLLAAFVALCVWCRRSTRVAGEPLPYCDCGALCKL